VLAGEVLRELEIAEEEKRRRGDGEKDD